MQIAPVEPEDAEGAVFNAVKRVWPTIFALFGSGLHNVCASAKITVVPSQFRERLADHFIGPHLFPLSGFEEMGYGCRHDLFPYNLVVGLRY